MADTEGTLTLEGFEIDNTNRDEQGWRIEMHPTEKRCVCPCCGQISDRIHSYYKRTLRDLPVAAMHVTLVIYARRFECRNDGCKRHVFCERLGGLSASGFAINGYGGARLAKQLGPTETIRIRVSGDAIIAIVRNTPQVAVHATEVMGVDD